MCWGMKCVLGHDTQSFSEKTVDLGMRAKSKWKGSDIVEGFA